MTDVVVFHPAVRRSRVSRTLLWSLVSFAAGTVLAPVAVHVGFAMMLADGIARAVGG